MEAGESSLLSHIVMPGRYHALVTCNKNMIAKHMIKRAIHTNCKIKVPFLEKKHIVKLDVSVKEKKSTPIVTKLNSSVLGF